MANGKFKVQEFPTKRGGEDVVGWENTTIFSSVDFPRYNPDSLVQRHGLKIYQKMMLDEQVKAAITFKRDAVTSRDWVLDWASDTKLSDLEKTKRNAMLTKMLENMNGAFVDKLNSILSGLVYGYSVTEKVYGIFEFDGRPQSGIIALLPKDCSTFWFYTDDYGQLRDFRQKVSGKEQALDITKFVHYVHAPEEDEWHGASELRAAYRSYYAKDLMIKYWLIWGERAAGGFVKATRTAEAQVQPNTPAWDKLEKALGQIKTVGSILLPVGIDVEMIMPPPGDGFEAAIKFHDLAIAKSVLVPNLLGVSHTGETGAYAQSQTQLEAFFWTLNATSRRLSACITEQVLKDAGESLFPDGQVPDFAFKPASLEHVKWVVQSWKDLVGAKVVTTTPEDEERLRQILEMPAKTPEEIEAAQNEAHAKSIEVASAGKPAGKPFGQSDEKPAQMSRRADFEWNEDQHPRVPAGGPGGGQFGEGGGGDSSDSSNGPSLEHFQAVESRLYDKLGLPNDKSADAWKTQLTPAQQAKYDAAKEEYRNLPRSEDGRVINVDLARELSTDYGASLDSRSQLSAAVHEPASQFMKRYYADELAKEALGGRDDSVLFTAGGTGSGKTTAIENIPVIQSLSEHAQAIYDTNMNSFGSAKDKIDMALAAGKTVTVAYVYRDPVESLVSDKGGAVTRAEREGRTVPLEKHAETHVGSMEVVQRIKSTYAGDPRVRIYGIDNSHGRGGAVESSFDNLRQNRYNVPVGELRSALDELKSQGRVSERVYRGFTQPTTPKGWRGAVDEIWRTIQRMGRSARGLDDQKPEQEDLPGQVAPRRQAAPPSKSRYAAFTRATQRVNFAVINAREESIAQRSVPAAADVIARGVKKATGAVDVAMYTDANVALISDVALDGPTIGKLRAVFVDTLRTSWEVGASMARNELERARGGHFTNRVKLEALRDKAAEYLAGNGFRMAGNASDATKAIIQQELLSGVKGAKSTTDVRSNIWDRLVSRGLLTRGAVLAIETDTNVHAALDELWQDTEAGAAHYLDTLVRTNMFEALNEARYEEFTSPDLGDFVRALEYAAVLDEKTTEICQSLDGNVYEADSEVWDTYRPPNHYNCRSVLVPITAVDNWDGIESPEPAVEPQEGFK